MFDRLGDWLAEQWDNIKFIEVIPCYEAGVLIRLGKHVATLKGGTWYWKIPWADDFITENILMNTINLPFQKVDTKDHVSLTLAAVLKYKIEDIKLYLLSVNEPEDALSAIPMGIIREEIEKVDRIDVGGDSDSVIKRRIRAEAKKYGVDVMEVTYTTRAKVETMVLMHEGISFGED